VCAVFGGCPAVALLLGLLLGESLAVGRGSLGSS